jgi:homoserine dehydrogenase
LKLGVNRRGIEADRGYRPLSPGPPLKLICRAEREGQAVRASVMPELLGPGDPLYSVDGASSAVSFETDVLPSLTIVEGNPGPETTAYGLLADLVAAVGSGP